MNRDMSFILWIAAVVLVIAGIVLLFTGNIILGVVLIVLGLLVGPGGFSIFRGVGAERPIDGTIEHVDRRPSASCATADAQFGEVSK